ncbi:MAG: RDD family protein [Acidobacteriia bacterium]|nr:RDD family protein [Terriglobia bacterium]
MEDGAIWRQEVASRVESYRARRRRPIRERSLPLDFERAVNREITSGNLSASREEESEVPSLESHAETVENFVPELQTEERYHFERPQDLKIIEFPRQAMLPVTPPSIEELAETIIDRPRILDVSEEVETTAPLADINVAPEAEQRPAMEFELPLQVAPMSQRVFAGIVDALLALVGAAVFVIITLKAGVPMPHAKIGFLVALAAPCLLWAIYEYMFLVYAGTTPGMKLARLELVTFDGVRARRRTRRGRALAMVLATLSLGLGLVWALLDEDTLCWHDRITRTYVVAGSS